MHPVVSPLGFLSGDDPLAAALFYFWSNTAHTVNSLQFFYPWSVNSICDGVERFIIAPNSSTIKKITVNALATGVGAANTTYTLRVNGVATALTVVISNVASPYAASASGSISIAAGDRISLSKQHSVAVATAPSRVLVRLEGV